jgi:hypothetical protein
MEARPKTINVYINTYVILYAYMYMRERDNRIVIVSLSEGNLGRWERKRE